jgi:hypothetical protein
MKIPNRFMAILMAFTVSLMGFSASADTSGWVVEEGIVGEPMTAAEIAELELLIEELGPLQAELGVISPREADVLLFDSLEQSAPTVPGFVTKAHGCHKKHCLDTCPKCTYPNKSTKKGHCKKNGNLHNCKKYNPGTK